MLWHVDRKLFGRNGAATNCIIETLDILATYHEMRVSDRNTVPRAIPDSFTKGSLPVSIPQSSVQLEESYKVDSDLMSDEDPESGEQVRDVNRADDATVEPAVNATVDTKSPPLIDLATADWPGFMTIQPKLLHCAKAFSDLPLAWQDMRVMLGLMRQLLHDTLAEAGADPGALDMNDGILAALGVLVGDLRVRQLEQEIAGHREEAVVTQHLAGRFLANASHELRTPLTAVLGFAELLQEETYGPLTPEQITAVGHIENSAQNLLEIVNNLLDLLHIRSGKLNLQYRLMDIASVLENLHTILLPLAGRKSVRFVMELAPDLDSMQADENIVRHIVYHLLSSALRATPAGGEVTLSAWRETDTIIIEARDTALHLPPEAVANMMEPFPRLENSPARGYEGWEVGLPLVRRYVDLHQGVLTMESLPEQGTVFRVALPIRRLSKND